MATEENNKIVRKFTRLLQFFNVRNTEDAIKKETDLPHNSEVIINHFSPDELEQMVVKPVKRSQRLETSPLDYLEDVSKGTKEFIGSNKQIQALNPEIRQAKEIFISSILSPNDMQTGAITVTANVPGLDEAVQKELNTYLNDFFNDEIHMGVSLERWLGKALFDEGAAPVLVTPYQNVTHLNTYAQATTGMESLDFIDVSAVDMSNENDLDHLIADMKQELLALDYDTPRDKMSQLRDGDLKNIAQEAIKATKATSSVISYSYDVTKIAKASRSAKKKSNELADNLDKYFLKNEDDAKILMALSGDIDGDSGKKTHALITELPSSAVIPICIPGSESSHIGYFVLTDEWGNPLDEKKLCSTEKAANSISGSKNNVFSSLNNSAVYFKGMKTEDRTKASEVAFSITIKHMLEKTFSDNGMEGVSIDKYQALGNCLFHHMLLNTKVNVIFVPEPLMVYYAFDFRENGTGKSLLEELYYILALRTTLIIANIMGTIKNAIDKETIAIELDEQDTNIEQTLEMIKNTFIKKNAPKFYNDPDMVTRDIVANSLTIVPRNIPGLEHSLEVSTERRGADSQSVDDTLMEKLSNMLSLGLGIPPSALNQLSEDEYSRSVATNNLFFANKIRKLQRTCSKSNNKFAKLVVRYSTYIKDKIKEILNENDVEGKSAANIDTVISNIDVTLANPNIVATKAQYEELKEFTDLVDNLVEKIFPDELFVDGDDSTKKDIMGTLRAHVSAKLLKDYINAVGMQNLIEIPAFDEIDIDKITDVQQFLTNIRKGVDNLKKVLGGDEDNSSY